MGSDKNIVTFDQSWNSAALGQDSLDQSTAMTEDCTSPRENLWIYYDSTEASRETVIKGGIELKAWVDGTFMDARDVQVSPLSHSFGRGLVIFEVINILDTVKGTAFLCLPEHNDRFFNSASILQMPLSVNREELTEACLETARVNDVKSGICKFFGYYPAVELSTVPKDRTVRIAIFCGSYEEFGYNANKARAAMTSGIPSYRKLHPATMPIKAKISAGYVGAYLADLELAAKGIKDAIFIDTDGYVCEGGTHNDFFVKDGVIKTPTLDRILAGTTRKVVIDVARDIGITVEETDIKAEELPDFDEAFVSGSLITVVPLETFEGKPIGKECPGPVTQKVKEAMELVYEGKKDEYLKYLTFV